MFCIEKKNRRPLFKHKLHLLCRLKKHTAYCYNKPIINWKTEKKTKFEKEKREKSHSTLTSAATSNLPVSSHKTKKNPS